MDDGLKLHCKKCDRVWTYKGASTYYATCPRCMTKVDVRISSVKIIEEKEFLERFGLKEKSTVEKKEGEQ